MSIVTELREKAYTCYVSVWQDYACICDPCEPQMRVYLEVDTLSVYECPYEGFRYITTVACADELLSLLKGWGWEIYSREEIDTW